MMGVYLLCGEHPTKPSVHYVGFTRRDWMDRVREHQAGWSKATAPRVKEGYTWRMAFWEESYGTKEEAGLRRALKKRNYSCCPRCGSGSMPPAEEVKGKAYA